MTGNFRGSPHIDTENVAPFYALALGEFRGAGGRVAVESSVREVTHVDTRHGFAKVDGRFPHWESRRYDGERSSLIYCGRRGGVGARGGRGRRGAVVDEGWPPAPLCSRQTRACNTATARAAEARVLGRVLPRAIGLSKTALAGRVHWAVRGRGRRRAPCLRAFAMLRRGSAEVIGEHLALERFSLIYYTTEGGSALGCPRAVGSRARRWVWGPARAVALRGRPRPRRLPVGLAMPGRCLTAASWELSCSAEAELHYAGSPITVTR